MIVVRSHYRTLARVKFQSAVTPSRSGMLARVLRALLPAHSLASPIRHIGDTLSRILNLFGPLQAARRFVCTLRQFRQEPRSVLRILFSPSPLCVVAHVSNRTTGDFGNVRKAVGAQNELR